MASARLVHMDQFFELKKKEANIRVWETEWKEWKRENTTFETLN